jgi:hypothetical protein
VIKVLAKDKGVYREEESEGSWRQNSDLKDMNHIKRLQQLEEFA